MDMLAWLLAVLAVIAILYAAILRHQIHRMRRQLELRQKEHTRQPLSLELMDAELNRLAAELNRCLAHEQLATLESARHEKQFKEMIMSISHDLRTPLTAIMGNLQMLEQGELNDADRRRLTVVSRQAGELSTLVEHFWEYAYYSIAEPALELERINMTNLVAECIADHVPELEERGLSVQFDPLESVYALADRECAVRILRNLIRNAILHAAGDIGMVLTTTEIHAVLAIQNPIAPDANLDISRIFDRFYSVDSSRGQATGLGLAIVKLLAQRMGGDARASQVGEILEIQVKLPV